MRMVRSLKGLYHLLVAIVANIRFGFPARRLTVIGVTGTDGKTTTTTIIYEILVSAGFKTSKITSVHAVIGGKEYDTGFHVTTPSAWQVQKYLARAVRHGDTHVVLEVTSHALSQSRVLGIPFAVGVITNVTHEHLDWHGTYENYLATKLRLFTLAEKAVVNRDTEEVYRAAKKIVGDKTLVTYGLDKNSQVNPETFPFRTALPGEFNRYNILAALAAAYILGVKKKTAALAVSAFTGIPGRMETITTKPYTVIVDFAHTPNALVQALRAVRTATKGKLIHVFGSAGLRDAQKRPHMGEASARFADISIVTEEDYRTENVNDIIDAIVSGMPAGHEVIREPDREKALARAVSLAGPGDCIIATGKGHEISLCRGRKEYPWSDQKCLRQLVERSNKKR